MIRAANIVAVTIVISFGVYAGGIAAGWWR
jgi:hypothetical protein